MKLNQENTLYEVEQKFAVADAGQFIASVESLGWRHQTNQQHADTYFNHPSRDFAQSKEALRIRRIDQRPLITYKGPKLAGTIKARREMEWALDPGDADGSLTESLLVTLGFRKVATVRKLRKIYLLHGGNEKEKNFPQPTIVLDQVEQLGNFTEIEVVVDDSSQIPQARQRITQLATSLGLSRQGQTDETRSYLTMLLEKQGTDPTGTHDDA